MRIIKIVFLFFLVLVMSCGGDSDFRDVILEPAPVTLLFPENLSECIEGTILSDTLSEVTFRWEPSENTDEYEIVLTNLETNEITYFIALNTELPIILERGIQFKWSVISKSISSPQTEISDEWIFYNAGIGLTQFVPFPAIAITPADGSILVGTSGVSIIWEGNDLDNDIQTFDLHFDTFSDPGLFQENITNNQIDNIPVEFGRTYYWRVITKDQIGNISISNIFSFSIEN